MPDSWLRMPELDKRVALGDDFAGDAWRHILTGQVRWAVVGVDINIAKYEQAKPLPPSTD